MSAPLSAESTARTMESLFNDVPKLRAQNKAKTEAPKHLQLSEEYHVALNKHIEATGTYSSIIQLTKVTAAFYMSVTKKVIDHAFQILARLQLHLPGVFPWDVHSKLSIHYSDSIKKVKARNNVLPFHQCVCGSSGSSECQLMSWKDVRCITWVKLITTHEDKDGEYFRLPFELIKHNIDGRLIVVNEISGVLDHSADCQAQVEMYKDPIIPLYPDVQKYLEDLATKNILLTQMQHLCKEFALKQWGDTQGDTLHHYRLTANDSSSIYQTVTQKCGIPQCSSTKENLDNWFHKDSPKPPPNHPNITQSVLHYRRRTQSFGVNHLHTRNAISSMEVQPSEVCLC